MRRRSVNVSRRNILLIGMLIGMSMSKRRDIEVLVDKDGLRPIDANYQMFDNLKILVAIDWRPVIPAYQMFSDLLDHRRTEIARGRIPLDR
jgi:GDPmannose 4,6-dehydratase